MTGTIDNISHIYADVNSANSIYLCSGLNDVANRPKKHISTETRKSRNIR